jgi:hypothetical protein
MAEPKLIEEISAVARRLAKLADKHRAATAAEDGHLIVELQEQTSRLIEIRELLVASLPLKPLPNL